MKSLASEFDEVAASVIRASGCTVSSAADLHRVLDGLGTFAGVMRALAAQSRLLALNAAIEAARIGPAARVFAVVVGEMQSLADAAARTASDIEAGLAEASALAETNREAVAMLRRAVDAGSSFAGHLAAAVRDADLEREEFA